MEGRSAMNRSYKHIVLLPLSQTEMISMGGGSVMWNTQVARTVGKSLGYTIKKVWRAILFLSNNLLELQSNTAIIYK